MHETNATFTSTLLSHATATVPSAPSREPGGTSSLRSCPLRTQGSNRKSAFKDRRRSEPSEKPSENKGKPGNPETYTRTRSGNHPQRKGTGPQGLQRRERNLRAGGRGPMKRPRSNPGEARGSGCGNFLTAKARPPPASRCPALVRSQHREWVPINTHAGAWKRHVAK